MGTEAALAQAVDSRRAFRDRRAVMVYEASVRGEMSSVLRAAFADCEVAPAHGTTGIRFVPPLLHEVLDRIQEFGLDLLDLRLCHDRGPDAVH